MELKAFQRDDVEFIKRHRHRVLVASGPGTGKTPVTVRALAESHQEALPALIVCPASVVENWVREINAWAPGIPAIPIEDSKSPIPFSKDPQFYVISWDLLRLRWAEFVRKIRTVVADECHFAKSDQALRTQALMGIAGTVGRVMLLSGTPVINTKADLRVLYELLGTDNPPTIRRLLEVDVPEVPEKKRSYLNVTLKDRDAAEYERALHDFEEWLRREKERLLGEGLADNEVESALEAEALVKIGYLRRLVGAAKVPAAVEWISRAIRLGEPIVVFAEHQEVLKRLTKQLRQQRIKHVVLEGSTSAKKRQEAIDLFQANKIPVFIGTKAAKEGITLTAARHLLFVERYWTSAEEEQAEDRIRRIGQRSKTTIWFLHAQGTVDDRVDQIVRDKRRIVRSAIGAAIIAESDAENIRTVVRTWGEFMPVPREGVDLGHGLPLPPLPRPRNVLAVVFEGSRWNAATAKIWCDMNGFKPRRTEGMPGKMKVPITRDTLFRPGSFRLLQVTKEIKMIVGERLQYDNKERVLRAQDRNSG